MGHFAKDADGGDDCILIFKCLGEGGFRVVCLEDFDIWDRVVGRGVSSEDADVEVCGEKMFDYDGAEIAFGL